MYNKDFIVIGMTKVGDGSGYLLEFIGADKPDEEGKVIETVFIKSAPAKTLGEFLIGKSPDTNKVRRQ